IEPPAGQVSSPTSSGGPVAPVVDARYLTDIASPPPDFAKRGKVGGLDEDIVEAACLAHDLGHPPFGHIAEKELQRLLKDKADQLGVTEAELDSFEGNAQTFRIVTKLAFRSLRDGDPALDLTRASLNAILKYPWYFGEQPEASYKDKWSAYRTESDEFTFARLGAESTKRSIEAQIMDWADDIAYAVHDVEDFYRAGLIPLDRLVYDGDEASRFVGRATARLGPKGFDPLVAAEAFNRLRRSYLPKSAYSGSRADRVAVHELASSLITRYTEAAAIRILPTGTLSINEARGHEVAMLKELTWYYVIDNPSLATVQRGQRAIIAHLFKELSLWTDTAATDRGEDARLPATLRELLSTIRNDQQALAQANERDDLLRCRAVVDYIASLTERQAVDLYARLTGRSDESALEVWLRS
ncbi:MAG: deoxyguanosinetriphosphate triphosphohydrolase family protein, partial [Gammaproteobacteria bacterium]